MKQRGIFTKLDWNIEYELDYNMTHNLKFIKSDKNTQSKVETNEETNSELIDSKDSDDQNRFLLLNKRKMHINLIPQQSIYIFKDDEELDSYEDSSFSSSSDDIDETDDDLQNEDSKHKAIENVENTNIMENDELKTQIVENNMDIK
eukprot:172801_1